jgi:hypothetical protein
MFPQSFKQLGYRLLMVNITMRMGVCEDLFSKNVRLLKGVKNAPPLPDVRFNPHR